MPIKDDASTRFADEIRVISPWAYAVALLSLFSVPALLVFLTDSDRASQPVALVLAMGILAGILLACFVLLVGYVNGDAGRRGMSRVLWTLIAIFVPNGLGIVLYFVLRKPRVANCPQCGALVEPGFGFCPRCRHRLTAVCPRCQRSVHAGDKFCPYCGADFATAANA